MKVRYCLDRFYYYEKGRNVFMFRSVNFTSGGTVTFVIRERYFIMQIIKS